MEWLTLILLVAAAWFLFIRPLRNRKPTDGEKSYYDMRQEHAGRAAAEALGRQRVLTDGSPVPPLAPSTPASLTSKNDLVITRSRAGETTADPTRLAEIDAFYANDLNAVELRLSDCVPAIIPQKSFDKAVRDIALKSSTFKDEKNLNALGQILRAGQEGSLIGETHQALDASYFRRTLRDMSDAERAILRLAEILMLIGHMKPVDVLRVKVPIVWSNGSCLLKLPENYNVATRRAHLMDGLKLLIEGHFGDVSSASETVQTALRAALAPSSGLPDASRVALERYLFSGNRWLTATESRTALAAAPSSPTVLRLGSFPEGDGEMLFDMRESLITIAPPGTGKSQAHVLRNLLYLDAPAVVLDIKGEMLVNSVSWRSQNVGPCYWFAPGAPERSHRFNPLDLVRTDPDRAWDDARRLADLLVVPSPRGGDDYFEGRARDMITTAVLDVALSETGDRRTMASVLDRLYLSEGPLQDEWFDHLGKFDLPQLRRQASALRGMPQKQREGVLDSARRQLEVWQSPALEKLTTTSDFSADTLRQEKATLYLWVTLEDVKKYASVLRVIIGQMVAGLCRQEPESGALPVTFFLDELPRLGRMDVIEEALDVGRGYGVRLWMFCQNLGQLRTAYPNADGMVGNCAARCFMNPDEDTAKWMSENLGVRQGLLDGRRKPLAEPHQLTGPEFANQLVVFSRGNLPARLDKRPAYADPECARRMATSNAAE